MPQQEYKVEEPLHYLARSMASWISNLCLLLTLSLILPICTEGLLQWKGHLKGTRLKMDFQ